MRTTSTTDDESTDDEYYRRRVLIRVRERGKRFRRDNII